MKIRENNKHLKYKKEIHLLSNQNSCMQNITDIQESRKGDSLPIIFYLLKHKSNSK